MKVHSTNNKELRKVRITPETLKAYEERDKSLDNADPDAPVLPPEMWANGVIGKYYRPRKEHVNVRIDSDIMAWLKSQGSGHLTRINELLREAMMAQQEARR